MLRQALIAAAAWLVAGTAWAEDLPADKFKAFAVGRTTKAQVLASLGAPSNQNRNPDGRSALFYDYTVPVTETNKDIHEVLVGLVFDTKDVLLNTRVYVKDSGPAASSRGGTGAGAGAPSSSADIQDETLLAPLAKGFKIASHSDAKGVVATEYVPEGETVQDWSRMITVQVFHGQTNATPDAFADGMRARWAAACKGAEFETIGGAADNGYPASLRRFSCPLNSQTGKPENTYMKFVAGADAFYVVQYAYRAAVTPETAAQALDYLKSTKACDPRKADHPCPKLEPVSR